MDIAQLKARNFTPEFVFNTSRSSGPGGQHVNKVNTRVELRFNIHQSQCLSESEKSRLLKNSPPSYKTQYGELLFSSQNSRSQSANKEDVIEKFYQFLQTKLTPPKKRIKTKPKKSAIEKRLTSKKRLSELKKYRKRIQF